MLRRSSLIKAAGCWVLGDGALAGMNIDGQTILVIGVIVVALIAAGLGVRKRLRSFRKSSNCEMNCGCDGSKGATRS